MMMWLCVALVLAASPALAARHPGFSDASEIKATRIISYTSEAEADRVTSLPGLDGPAEGLFSGSVDIAGTQLAQPSTTAAQRGNDGAQSSLPRPLSQIQKRAIEKVHADQTQVHYSQRGIRTASVLRVRRGKDRARHQAPAAVAERVGAQYTCIVSKHV